MLEQKLNLDDALEKKVRAKKNFVGNVVAITDRFLLVASPSGAKYNIPRWHIDRSIGNEFELDASFKELQRYRMR